MHLHHCSYGTQCDVGHVMCSPCREKLQSSASGARCHVCRAPPASAGFRRCHAMEQLVDSIRVPCPHAAHGCANKPAYHDRERHAGECAHAPCRCPASVGGAQGASCAFAAPTGALVGHLAAAHGWPCTAEPDARRRPFAVALRDGFNFLSAARGGAQHLLLLLNVATSAFGRAVSAVQLRPRAAATASSSAAPVGRNNAKCELELKYSNYPYQLYPKGHYQTSRFEVACTDGAASNDLPDPSASFQFFIPKYAAAGSGSDEEEAVFQVTAAIFIGS